MSKSKGIGFSPTNSYSFRMGLEPEKSYSFLGFFWSSMVGEVAGFSGGLQSYFGDGIF